FSLVGPLRSAVSEKLLENIEPDLAVIQGVTKVAALVNPGRWNPAQRQVKEALDLGVAAPGTWVGEDGHVRLVRELIFSEHRPAVFAAVPDGNEIEFHLR